MKLPSGKYLRRKTIRSFYRFMPSLVLSITSMVLLIYFIQKGYNIKDNVLGFKLVYTFILGIPMFIFVQLLSERMEWTRNIRILVHIGTLVLMATYFLSLNDITFDKSLIRFLTFLLISGLLVLLAPFVSIRNNLAFWQFNHLLMGRMLRTILYGFVLFIAVSLAILAFDELFEVSVGEKIYGQLFVIVTFLFCPWFFLAAIPRHFHALDKNFDYPATLKVFVQFILIPVIILYTIILYAYFIKIIALWQWPHGWVGSLVLGYSILVLFTFLIIYPIRNNPAYTYIRYFSKFFPYAIGPLILILFLSLFRRISDYGITENRYFVLVLGIWLLFVTTYLILNRFNNIKNIQSSFALFLFLSVVGPWNAFQVSNYSQMNRFTDILKSNELLKDNRINKMTSNISYNDYQNLVSTSNYIIENFGYDQFKPFFKQNLDSLDWKNAYIGKYSSGNPIIDLFSFEIIYDSTQNQNTYNPLYINTMGYNKSDLINISKYQYLTKLNVNFGYPPNDSINDFEKIFNIDNQVIRISFNKKWGMGQFYLNGTVIDSVQLAQKVSLIPDSLITNYGAIIPEEYLTFELKNDSAELLFKINSIEFSNKKPKIKHLLNLNADIFINVKNHELLQ